MNTLSLEQVEQISGGGLFGQVAAGLAGAAAIAGGLAMVPTPASPALAGFAVLTGVLGAGFAYVEART